MSPILLSCPSCIRKMLVSLVFIKGRVNIIYFKTLLPANIKVARRNTAGKDVLKNLQTVIVIESWGILQNYLIFFISGRVRWLLNLPGKNEEGTVSD